MSWAAIIGAVLEGVSSRSEGKASERKTRKDREHDFRMAKFNSELVNNMRRQERSEKARGWDNWFTDDKPNRDVGEGPNLEEYLRNTR